MKEWGQFVPLLIALGGLYGFIRSAIQRLEERLGTRIDRMAQPDDGKGLSADRGATPEQVALAVRRYPSAQGSGEEAPGPGWVHDDRQGRGATGVGHRLLSMAYLDLPLPGRYGRPAGEGQVVRWLVGPLFAFNKGRPSP